MTDHELPKPTTTTTTPTPVWDAVSQWISVTNPDWEYWWQLSGPHISHLIMAAGYPLEAQYNALIFHYHWIVPYLGPAPGNSSWPKWKSLLGNEGSPIEYSWKWNTAKGKPDVRYCIEAIGPYASPRFGSPEPGRFPRITPLTRRCRADS